MSSNSSGRATGSFQSRRRFVQGLAAGGAIPFSRYMELALYAPGLGYYSAGATKLGADGDFVTATTLLRGIRHQLRRRLPQRLAGGSGTR